MPPSVYVPACSHFTPYMPLWLIHVDVCKKVSKSQTLNPISLASLLSFAIHFVVVNNFIESKITFFIEKKM
jgi:hypothetical protein